MNHRNLLVLIVIAFGLRTGALYGQTNPDVRALLAQLRDPKTTDSAERRVLELASQNSRTRQEVVNQLPEMIDGPKTDRVWANAVRLAGSLGATEAIPSLRRALLRGPLGGMPVYSMTGEIQLDNDIVAKALSQIGDAAIPAATDLLKSEKPKERRRGVLILRNINTPAAKKALEEQLPRETDPGIKELIEVGLRP